MPVNAVLFDLGNTLWHIPDPPPVQQVRDETVGRIFRLLRSWGVEPEGELRFIGRDIRLALQAAIGEAYDGDLREPDCVELTQRAAGRSGLQLERARAEELWHTWNLEGPFFGRRLFGDALEALDALRDAGYRLGCVTNRPYDGPSFHNELDELGLRSYFEALSVSCDIGYMKPHPKIFEHALETLGVEPAEAVMVGDSLRADVAGGQALGMIGVWRRHDAIKEQVEGVEPDFIIHELRELPSLPCFTNGA